MANDKQIPVPISPSSLPMRLESSSVKQAYTDRMMLSEAIEAVAKLISAYPTTASKVEKSYIGTMAALLCQYPRSAATKCADPLRGVARTTKFLPTVADVVAWCEQPLESMTRIVDFEDRSARQLRERREQEEFDAREPLEHRRKVVDRIRKQMAAAGMTLEGDRAQEHGETPLKVMAKLGVTEAQWNAIPDGPPPGHWQRLQASHMRKATE